jgi:hypothetical protein
MHTLDIRHRVPLLLAIAAVIIIVIDLFSTPANAGRMPSMESSIPVVVAADAKPVKLALAKATPAPLLEEDPEFAPQFKQVVARNRPAQQRSGTLFGRVFSGKLLGGHPALL